MFSPMITHHHLYSSAHRTQGGSPARRQLRTWQWTQILLTTRDQVRFILGSTRQGMTLWGRVHRPRFFLLLICPGLTRNLKFFLRQRDESKHKTTWRTWRQALAWGTTSTVTPTLLSGKGDSAFSNYKIWCSYILGVPGFQHPHVQLSQKNIAHLMARATIQGSLVLD